MTGLLRVVDASYAYPESGVVALRSVRLEVEAGTVVAVVGRNGSGKTTLAKLLNGLLRPTAGAVLLDGRDTRAVALATLAASVGYAFQDPNHQLFARTVADELAFGPRQLGWSRAAVEARVAEVAADFGIEPQLGLHPYRLARPGRKLVAIASVVAMRPRVLVLDEPTTGQDGRTAETIVEHIARLRTGGTAVVVISHDLGRIAAVADRIVILADGVVLADGSPRAVLGDADVLARAGLVAPPIVRLSAASAGGRRGPIALTVAELAAVLAAEHRP